jgi:hypothetical protein
MFLPILMGHSAHFSVPGMISSCHDNRYMVWDVSRKLTFSCFLVPFSRAITQSFKLSGRFPAMVATDSWFEGHHQNSHFRVFYPFSCSIAHNSLFPGQLLVITKTHIFHIFYPF